MYLSRIKLNTQKRETMRALTSPQVVHGAVEQSFPEQDYRNLWRVDWLNSSGYLLVLSKDKPDFSHIAEQFGFPSVPLWETKDYNHLLSRLQAGQEWQFRLRANPTRSSFKEQDKASGRGKVFAHVTQEQQRHWLLSKAAACGFHLNEDEFDVVYSQWYKFKKGIDKQIVTLRTADFEGKLTITDLQGFKQSLLSGIGRAKAYGCGLLTIANYRNKNHG